MGEFGKDFFLLDPSVSVKQEPTTTDPSTPMNMSASVPIPPRRDLAADYRDFGIDFENSQSPLYADLGFTAQIQPPGGHDGNCWGLSRLISNDEMLKCESFGHMDEDDIFQVDKADLIQGPTLAELNANDDNLLGDLNFDDLLLPEESTYIILEKGNPHTPDCHLITNPASPFPPLNNMLHKEIDSPSSVTGAFDYYKYKTPASAFSPESHTSSNSSIVRSTSSPSGAHRHRHSTLHELLVKREGFGSPDVSVLGQSFPERHSDLQGGALRVGRGQTSRLSSSAPTHLGFDQIWQRREPRKHLLSTSSLAECGSTSSISTGGLLSPDPPDFSVEDDDTDDDSDAHYEDFSSDNVDSDDEENRQNRHSSSRKDRYFWQYNIQAKGPKGQRLIMKSKMEDPHHLNRVTDPVFSPDCSLRGIKHSGKARKGDGNDLTPNSKKLYNIGKELDKLGRIINDMTPVSELPFNVRPTSRKEKNKLASRACRLKKKAQHEANKIKLNGLEFEHRRFLNAVNQGRQILSSKLIETSQERQEDLTMSLEKLLKSCSKVRIAGHTTEYVNKVLDKLKNGVNTTARIDDDS